MIRVGLVEDQAIVREGLRALLDLAEDIEVVLEAGDGSEALRMIPGAGLDVLLLDIRLPLQNGLAVLRQLSDAATLPPTIILTTFDDDEFVLGGIRAGAKGYLLKDVTFRQLIDAVREVARGGTLIQPALTDRIRRGFERPSLPTAATTADRLSPRETEILRLMAGGYSNPEIANALQLATGTVKNHISAILGKLGVRDRTRAVLKAIEHGYI